MNNILPENNLFLISQPVDNGRIGSLFRTIDDLERDNVEMLLFNTVAGERVNPSTDLECLVSVVSLKHGVIAVPDGVLITRLD